MSSNTSKPGSPLKVGDTLDGRYRIEALVGRGGMGEVYAAERIALSDRVAIKRLKSGASSAVNRSRFLVEARAAAHVRHPNVIQIFDFGEHDGLPYMVMELLEGMDLAACLKDRGRLDSARSLALLAPICAAVEAGHRRGIVHRDLKPSNVFIARHDDGAETVKVLDFGLACVTEDGGRDLTAAGMLVGTPRYMSPEQLSGQPVRPTSDVWALGVILYRMITGRNAFDGPNTISIATAIVKGVYIDPRVHVPTIPGPICQAIAAALTIDPSQRPSSPEQLARMAEMISTRTAAAPTRAVTVTAEVLEGETRSAAAGSGWSRVDLPQAPGFSHFVGREQQLAQLAHELTEALSGNARIALVVGEAGMGKTRLVERFLESAETRRRAVVLHGRFHDYAGSRPPAFETFVVMLESGTSCAIGEDSPIRRALEESASLEVDGERWRVFQAITEAFAAHAGSRPLVLSFDDLQWATRADLDLVDHLHQALGQRGTLVVATARRDEAPADASPELSEWVARQTKRRTVVNLRVGAFDEELARRWLDAAFGALRIHPRDFRRLQRASESSPFGLAELVRNLVTSGAIHRTDSCWVCGDLANVELPDTVQGLLRARLEKLDGDLREVLQVAAVIGAEFRFATLQHSSGRDEEVLDALVERAIDLRLLCEDGVSGGNDYRFASEPMRRMLYDSMRRRSRLATHRAVVDSLRRVYGDALERVAPVLAYHLDAIGDSESALRWGLEAGRRALGRFDNDAAASDLAVARRALDRLVEDGVAPDPETTARLMLAEGKLARRLGRLDAAITALRSIPPQSEREAAVEAALELSRCELDRGDLEDAARSALAALEAAGDDRLACTQARLAEVTALLRMGRAVEADERLARLLGQIDDAPAGLQSLAYRERAWAEIKLGRFAAAEPHARRALDLARMAGDLLAEHHALSALAGLFCESGDPHAATPLLLRALELSRRLSLRRREAIDLANLGEIDFGLSDLGTSLDHLHQALAIFIEIGDRACEGDCRVNIGRVMRAVGQRAEALAMLERGRAICLSTGRVEYATIAQLEEAGLHLAGGASRVAAGAFAAAAEACTKYSLPFRWKALAGRARALRAAGDTSDARAQADAALAEVESARDALAPAADLSEFDAEVQRLRQLVAELAD